MNKQNSAEFKEFLTSTDILPESKSDNTEDKENSNTNEPYPVKARLAFQTRTLSSLPLSTPETRSAIESHIVAALQRRALSADSKPNQCFDSSPLICNDTDSTACFEYLLWACAGMVLWKHPWIWPLILIVITIFIIKSLGKFFGVWTFLEKHICDSIACAKDWGSVRCELINFFP